MKRTFIALAFIAGVTAITVDVSYAKKKQESSSGFSFSSILSKGLEVAKGFLGGSSITGLLGGL